MREKFCVCVFVCTNMYMCAFGLNLCFDWCRELLALSNILPCLGVFFVLCLSFVLGEEKRGEERKG